MGLIRKGFGILLVVVLAAACNGSTEPKNVSAVFSLVGTPAISKSTSASNGKFITTVYASLTLQINAVGGDIVMDNAYTLPTLLDFAIYVGGVKTTLTAPSQDSFVINYSFPDGVPLVPLRAATFTVLSGTTVTLPITITFDAETSSGVAFSAGTYAVGVEAIRWATSTKAKMRTDVSMAGQATWRTPQVVLP